MRDTGVIISRLPREQDISMFYYHFPQDFKDSISWVEDTLEDEEWLNYKVVEGRLVAMSDLEIKELSEYNKILKDEERMEMYVMEQLLPPINEVQKAENTIEILTLLSEVL